MTFSYGVMLKIDLVVLQQRIEHAVAGTDHQMLVRLWQELDYRTDVCRVTNGEHMEHLLGTCAAR